MVSLQFLHFVFLEFLFRYFVKTCVEQLKKHDHQSFERVCKESEVCRRTGGNCLNVSKLLVNNTKNLSSDYNLCRALLRATAGATEIVGTWGFLVDCSLAGETLGCIHREIFIATSAMIAKFCNSDWLKSYGLRCGLRPRVHSANSQKITTLRPYLAIFVPIICLSFTKLKFRQSFLLNESKPLLVQNDTKRNNAKNGNE